MNRVSVIVPAYNSQNYIERAIYSVIEQKYISELLELEVIIVDDCSTDNTHDICSNVFKNEERVRILKHKENKGVAASRNTGVLEARGRFIFFLDSDDYIQENTLFILLQSIVLLPSASGVFSDYIYVNNKEERSQKISAINNPIAGGLLIKKIALHEIGLFNEGFKLFEEVDLRRRLAEAGHELVNIPLPLYRYRMHQNNITKNLDINSEYLKLTNKE